MSSSGMWSRPGGKGANVAAALGLAGAPVKMLGAVGKEATWPLDCLKERHVDTSHVHVSDSVPTGRAFIQVSTSDGENSIVLLKGANFVEETSLNDPAAWIGTEEETYVVLQNEIPLEVTKAYAAYASARPHVRAVFNPSPMLSQDELRAFPWEGIDVLIVNEGEAADMHEALSGRPVEASAAKALAALPAIASIQWIVVTFGSRGSAAGVLCDGSRTWVDVPATKAERVVNTTGAGDTFTGYLVSGILREQGAVTPERIHALMTRASVASAMAVEVDGAMESIPAAADVEKRL